MIRLLSIAAVFTFAVVYAAFAHSWYPIECCSGRDCIQASSMHYTVDGEMVVSVGDVTVKVPKGFPLRPSRDENVHICLRTTYPEGNIVPRCVFVPAGV